MRHPDSLAVLKFLNDVCGRHYRETDANLSVISARLNEPGVDVSGVFVMINRMAEKWKGTEFCEYLRPETLFRRSKFDGYYAARNEPVKNRWVPVHRNDGFAGSDEPNRAERILSARRESAAKAQAARQAVASQVAGHGAHER